jgi:hypothetical protein
MKPCTIGKRHKWVFVRNVTRKYQNGRTVQLTLKGGYRCECGATKYGQPGIEV